MDSGGDPTDIPDLTYEQFKRFHEDYYHPSNAYIYFYGDDDPEERLALLEAYLKAYDARPRESLPGLQPGFRAPRRDTARLRSRRGGRRAPRPCSP